MKAFFFLQKWLKIKEIHSSRYFAIRRHYKRGMEPNCKTFLWLCSKPVRQDQSIFKMFWQQINGHTFWAILKCHLSRKTCLGYFGAKLWKNWATFYSNICWLCSKTNFIDNLTDLRGKVDCMYGLQCKLIGFYLKILKPSGHTELTS